VRDGEPGSRAYFEELLSGRDRYAGWLHEELGYALTTGLRVLDVGSGQGMDVANYAKAGADAVGIDLTPRHVELAQLHLAALGLTAEIVLGDAEALPFEDGSFDRVSSNGVLHHTPDFDAALREIRRVLRPGGEARIIVYNRESFHYWLTQVLGRGIVRGELFRERSMAGVLSSGVEFSHVRARPFVTVHGRKDLKRRLERAGFARVSVHARHFHPGDIPLGRQLARVVPAVRNPSLLDRIGRLGGWYLIARGFK
jgi:ubiquinone/menaquinone biosynthesis C-methylase UbiE